MATGYLLTASDVEVLKDLLAEHRRRLQGPTGRPRVPELPLPGAPDVYLALVPSTGIPALSRGSDTSTGTSSSFGDDIPGAAECQLYQTFHSGGQTRVEPLGRREMVHNYTEAAIAGISWQLVVRDKFGTWWTVPSTVVATTVVEGEPGTGGSSSSGDDSGILPGGRLTLSATNPAPGGQIGSTLRYLSYVHGRIPIYDTAENRYIARAIGTPSIDIGEGTGTGTLGDAANVDVYAYWNGAAVQLEIRDRFPLTASTPYVVTDSFGIRVHTDFPERRWLGCFHRDGFGQTADLSSLRLLWNAYNRRRICGRLDALTSNIGPLAMGNGWEYTSAQFRPWNGYAPFHFETMFGASIEDMLSMQLITRASNDLVGTGGAPVHVKVAIGSGSGWLGYPTTSGVVANGFSAGSQALTVSDARQIVQAAHNPSALSGHEYWFPLEWSEASGVTTWHMNDGDIAPFENNYGIATLLYEGSW